MKKVGILGSGIVGQTLGSGFLKHGYEVMIGTRTASKLDEWKAGTNGKGQVGSFAETAAFGDLIVLAAKGAVAKLVLESAGAANLEGKIIIDATNPIGNEPAENGVLKFFTSLDRSLMEDLQEGFPGGRFVKGWSSVGSAFMVNPSFESRPTMFICGSDPAAKQEVVQIMDTFGWDTSDMGGVEGARAIEPLCILWCIPGFLRNEWGHAFKLLQKS